MLICESAKFMPVDTPFKVRDVIIEELGPEAIHWHLRKLAKLGYLVRTGWGRGTEYFMSAENKQKALAHKSKIPKPGRPKGSKGKTEPVPVPKTIQEELLDSFLRN